MLLSSAQSGCSCHEVALLLVSTWCSPFSALTHGYSPSPFSASDSFPPSTVYWSIISVIFYSLISFQLWHPKSMADFISSCCSMANVSMFWLITWSIISFNTPAYTIPHDDTWMKNSVPWLQPTRQSCLTTTSWDFTGAHQILNIRRATQPNRPSKNRNFTSSQCFADTYFASNHQCLFRW